METKYVEIQTALKAQQKEQQKLLATMAALRRLCITNTGGVPSPQKKRAGRPMKKRNKKRLGLPIVCTGRGGLSETGVFTFKILHSIGTFNQADLCYISLHPSTCSRILRRGDENARIKSVRDAHAAFIE